MIARLRDEGATFVLALQFLTRLPLPDVYTPARMAALPRWFPAAGALIGGLAALAWLAAAAAFPPALAALLSTAFGLLLTGCFHEDGFADACDGLGGGWDKAQILAIMKDSRIGSYGAIGIGTMLLAKWNALMEMDEGYLLTALVAGHAVSRFASTTLIYALDYVRDDAGSRAKPLATRMSAGALAVAAVFGLAPCALLPLPEIGYALAAVTLVTLAAARYFVRRIGGYTGDCLGATQQAAELAFYIGLLCNI